MNVEQVSAPGLLGSLWWHSVILIEGVVGTQEGRGRGSREGSGVELCAPHVSVGGSWEGPVWRKGSPRFRWPRPLGAEHMPGAWWI